MRKMIVKNKRRVKRKHEFVRHERIIDRYIKRIRNGDSLKGAESQKRKTKRICCSLKWGEREKKEIWEFEVRKREIKKANEKL